MAMVVGSSLAVFLQLKKQLAITPKESEIKTIKNRAYTENCVRSQYFYQKL